MNDKLDGEPLDNFEGKQWTGTLRRNGLLDGEREEAISGARRTCYGRKPISKIEKDVKFNGDAARTEK